MGYRSRGRMRRQQVALIAVGWALGAVGVVELVFHFAH
jgi:hypothetical protein